MTEAALLRRFSHQGPALTCELIQKLPEQAGAGPKWEQEWTSDPADLSSMPEPNRCLRHPVGTEQD